jgi:hypothetical protein
MCNVFTVTSVSPSSNFRTVTVGSSCSPGQSVPSEPLTGANHTDASVRAEANNLMVVFIYDMNDSEYGVSLVLLSTAVVG